MPPRILESLACFFAALLITPTEGNERTNVVLFVVDDLGWRDLSCQGSDYYKTPNIDQLANNGVRFTQAYAAAAICSPTRASILTGKYPARLLLTQWLPAGRWDPLKNGKKEGRFLRSLPLEEFTLAEALREADYRTIHLGKWHLGGAPFSLPEHHGFDVNVAGQDHGAPGSYFFPYEGSWKIPTTDLKVFKQTLPDGEPGEYLTDRLTDEALKHIGEEPFFLYFPYYAVHTPLQAKPEKLARYESIPEEDRQGKPAYAAMVESVDDSVGRIVSRLRERELLDKTILILTSDNGGFAGATSNLPLRANKGSHYEGGIRIPLLISGPGIGKGVVSETPVITNDLYPTILELAGVAPEANLSHDGKSLTGLLSGKSGIEERPLFWHYPHYNQHPSSAPVSIVRRGDWKLIHFLETDHEELYDLRNDPGEQNEISTLHPEAVSRLRSELNQWREEVGAEPMLPNPRYQP